MQIRGRPRPDEAAIQTEDAGLTPLGIRYSQVTALAFRGFEPFAACLSSVYLTVMV